ncbi:hypothetical protein EX895_000860 [Sporisorium graminicola]|uniref:Uncharacterized protein n=1 Tax=Sporisorium graminicola TaxID=280036 RepID=A0A4U7L5R3_9BASI|nr:hypothetical protein EX895_000860 [Sporisorium graminicola]TKY90862.1 hypothetical protein EX895_000860 [Sporisorium graminicola]
MVTRIPFEAGPSYTSSNYFDLSPRRSLNPACRDVQAALSSFRFSSSTLESPSSDAIPANVASEDDEYVEPSCSLNSNSRRPSVQRTSSAPEPSSSKSTLFVEPMGPTMLRPSLARSCSESRASGVLERRRHKITSKSNSLPSTLILDFTNLPMTMGAGNLGLLRAARKAIAEPSGFDWDRAATSAPPSSFKPRFVALQEQKSSVNSTPVRPEKTAVTVSLPASTTASTSTSPQSPRVSVGLPTSRSCAASCWSKCASASNESEWDWALAGTARATHEAMRFSAFKEKREPVHDIWQQLPDWVSRRSSLGGRDADLSLRGPGLYNPFGPAKSAKDQAEASATASLVAAAAAATSAAMSLSLSNQSPRNSISGRGRVVQSKVSVHVPYRVLEEMPPPQELSVSPRASFVGARRPSLSPSRSQSVERVAAAIA